jgi:RNA polymerase sigma factor (sigma-70 family)
MNDDITQNDYPTAKHDQLEAETEQEDSLSFGAIYDCYAASIYRYILSRTGNIEDTKDLTSQTFLTAIEAFSRYREQGYVSAWLFSIARSKYIDYLRKMVRQSRMEQVPNIDLELDLLNQVVATERIVALRRKIRALSEEDQELLRLRYVADLSFPEMAHLLKRKEDAVKKSLYRLQARLQSQMEQDDE